MAVFRCEKSGEAVEVHWLGTALVVKWESRD